VFVRLACLTYAGWASVDPARALRMLADRSELAHANIHNRRRCRRCPAVRERLDGNPASVRRKEAPLHWTPLLYACYSRLEPTDAKSLDAGGRAPAAVARRRSRRRFLHSGSYAFTALTGAFGRGEGLVESATASECDALASCCSTRARTRTTRNALQPAFRGKQRSPDTAVRLRSWTRHTWSC